MKCYKTQPLKVCDTSAHKIFECKCKNDKEARYYSSNEPMRKNLNRTNRSTYLSTIYTQNTL